MTEGAEWPLLVVPRIVARTTEIVRAIVRIEGGEGLEKTPVVTVPATEKPTTPSREDFLEAVRGKSDAGSPEKLDRLLGALEQLGLYVDPLPGGVALRFPDPGESDTEFRFLRINNKGRVRLGRLKKQLEREGYSPEIAIRYADTISRWVPGTSVNPSTADLDGGASDHTFPAKVLIEGHRDEYLRLVSETIDAIRAATHRTTA